MSDGPKLLPCPFCGGKAHLCTRKTPYPWIAKCDECDAIAGGSAFQNDEWNAHCWNARTDHVQTLIAEAVAAEREVCAARDRRVRDDALREAMEVYRKYACDEAMAEAAIQAMIDADSTTPPSHG